MQNLKYDYLTLMEDILFINRNLSITVRSIETADHSDTFIKTYDQTGATKKVIFNAVNMKKKVCIPYQADLIDFTKDGYESGYHFGSIDNCQLKNITKMPDSYIQEKSESEEILQIVRKFRLDQFSLANYRCVVVKSDSVSYVKTPISTKFLKNEYSYANSICFVNDKPLEILNKADYLITNLSDDIRIELMFENHWSKVDSLATLQLIKDLKVQILHFSLKYRTGDDRWFFNKDEIEVLETFNLKNLQKLVINYGFPFLNLTNFRIDQILQTLKDGGDLGTIS